MPRKTSIAHKRPDQDSLLSDISLGGVTMKVFISQPMIGFSREDVLRNRQEAGRSIEGALYEG
jgi:hypothetical protein